jgi:stress-induced-phosphoprotein 1
MGSLLGGFNDPSLMAKLMVNPATSAFMNQPDFVEKIREVQRDPKSFSKHLQDQRMMAVFQVLLSESGIMVGTVFF